MHAVILRFFHVSLVLLPLKQKILCQHCMILHRKSNVLEKKVESIILKSIVDKKTRVAGLDHMRIRDFMQLAFRFDA